MRLYHNTKGLHGYTKGYPVDGKRNKLWERSRLKIHLSA